MLLKGLKDWNQWQGFMVILQLFEHKKVNITSFKAPRTCHDIRASGLRDTGSYFLDPDGLDSGFGPIKVHCDLRTGNLVGLMVN